MRQDLLPDNQTDVCFLCVESKSHGLRIDDSKYTLVFDIYIYACMRALLYAYLSALYSTPPPFTPILLLLLQLMHPHSMDALYVSMYVGMDVWVNRRMYAFSLVSFVMHCPTCSDSSLLLSLSVIAAVIDMLDATAVSDANRRRYAVDFRQTEWG